MVSKRFLYILIGLLLLGIGILAFQKFKNTEIINLDSTGTSIVAFGDSLVYGVGSTPGNDFVSVLSRRLGVPIVNMGVSGNTTADGLARVNDIFEHNPKIVIVLLGGNDFLRRVPLKTTFANLDQIVNTIQSRGSAVLILGVRGGLLSDGYNDAFEDFAESHGTGFVPNVLDGLLGDVKLMSDQIHPNDTGYRMIADKVEPVLRDLLKKE